MKHRDEDLLRELYHEEEMTTKEIAKELRCCRQTIEKWMKRFDIERRDGLSKTDYRYRDETVLRELRIERRMSQEQIAEELECSRDTIRRWMKKYDIPTQ